MRFDTANCSVLNFSHSSKIISWLYLMFIVSYAVASAVCAIVISVVHLFVTVVKHVTM